MRLLGPKAAVIALALSPTGHALTAVIVVDTNRDGRVDVEGKSDIEGKATWTVDRGAIFLANIGDTDQRCSKAITNDTLDQDIDKCHDASDNAQRNPKYLAPLRTAPNAELSANAFGSIHITEEIAADKVRIFVKEGTDWVFVGSNYTFTAEELKPGLELGIDSRDVRRLEWDGKATVHFSIKDGNEMAQDSVVLRVAPVLTHHHAQQAERVFVTNETQPGPQKQFVSNMETYVAQAGIKEPVYGFVNQDDDVWAQDFFEPGYTSFPGPDGPIVLRIMIRSSQPGRPAGRQIFERLRSDSVGAVQYLGSGESGTIDSTGNLETIPPYTHNGKRFPAGRTILGSWDTQRPLILPFLKAQEVQDPVELDTAWLLVGHVDEFIQFLPVQSERGWVMMVDDPRAGLKILENASNNGHGGSRAVSRPEFPSDLDACISTTTLDQVLEQKNFTNINEAAAQRIQGNIDIIKNETGITDDEIFRVPSLFYFINSAFDCSNTTNTTQPGNTTKPVDTSRAPGIVLASAKAARVGTKLKHRQVDEATQVAALYPGTINGVVLSDSYYLAPNPWGPIIDGKDILAEAVTAAYSRANYTVSYMDDWHSHHTGGGEIHCGSNTWRKADAPWW